jgi:hypothetical protein
MTFNPSDYEILLRVQVDEDHELLLLNSYGLDDSKTREILGKEVVLCDKNNNIVWQISSPQGDIHIFNSLTNKYETEIYDWNFSGIYRKDGKFLAEKFNGDVFEIDMKTGKAEYVYWTK